jgi:four helix bundle protein
MESEKIKCFEDLRTWQDGHALVLSLYSITKSFPVDERFGLVTQLRRAGISFTSNIAEGFSRRGGREKAQFYAIALGSLTEIQNQLLIARDVGYIAHDAWSDFANAASNLHKMTNGLIRSSGSRIP